MLCPDLFRPFEVSALRVTTQRAIIKRAIIKPRSARRINWLLTRGSSCIAYNSASAHVASSNYEETVLGYWDEGIKDVIGRHRKKTNNPEARKDSRTTSTASVTGILFR